MLKCFFEDTAPVGGKDTRALFNGLKIENAGEQYLQHQGKYPVVLLSFKEGKQRNFETSYLCLKEEIVYEYKRHGYVFDTMSDKSDRALFEKLSSGQGARDEYLSSLKFLCQCLENFHGQKAIILIDEYDVPLENSWFRGFYQDMIDFIRPLLSFAFKDNPHLKFAVITGCLRISKESIFTGLNNLDIISILSDHYDEYFGFTQDEMDSMLAYYGLESKTQLVKDWYDGYLFGKKEVYNPWSTIRIVDNLKVNINRYPEPFWANTSSNDIVRKLIDRADNEMKKELETLTSGGTISKPVHKDITYDEIDNDSENLWNFLFFTGYLKKISESVDEKGQISIEMKIPNKELDIIFENKVREWFRDRIKGKNLDTFFNAILNGDVEIFQRELSIMLAESISFMDKAENFYHGFMAGILSRLSGYMVKSNRESGIGRSDLMMYAPSGAVGKAIIFELKQAKSFSGLTTACHQALNQIEEKNYAAYWDDEGYDQILKYGIAFYKKSCLVMKGKL